jgi:hypothetical protein
MKLSFIILMVVTQYALASDFELLNRVNAPGRASSSAVGPGSVFMVLLNFPDKTATIMPDRLRENLDNMSSIFSSSSYRQVMLSTAMTARFYTLPHPTGYYGNWWNRDRIASDALDVIRQDYGDVLHNYDHVIYFFPPIPYWGYGGFSDGKEVWINGGSELYLLTHEMGHQFGLVHAHRWVPCNLGNPVDRCGYYRDQGDCFDIMTSRNPLGRDFGAYEKYLMGWIKPSQIKNVTTDGTYRIYRFDDPDAVGFPGLVLSFPRPNPNNGDLYWISYRYTPEESRNGAYVTWADAWSSILISSNPQLGCTEGAILPVGKTLHDQRVTITPVGIGGTGASRWLDVRITL